VQGLRTSGTSERHRFGASSLASSLVPLAALV